jgi:hypothetical protein
MKTMPLYLFMAMTLGLANCGAQNLLTNGSFELVAHPTNSVVTLSPGTTGLPGWVLEGTGTVYLATTPLTSWAFKALDGQQFLDFNESTLTLSQSFPTTPGNAYEVTFSAGLFQGPTSMQIIAQVVSTNGGVLGALTANVPQTQGWAPQSRFRFTATTPISTLQFHSSHATVNVDLAMDAVSVQPISPRLTVTREISQVRLCWQSETNRTYQLQFSTSLSANNWVDLGTPIPGSGGTDCILQLATDPQRFYRVILLP